MPFTIGEIPIGQIVDGEMVLRDVIVDMSPPGQYFPMPSTPTRSVPTRPEAPRQTTMAIGEEDGGRMMPPPLPERNIQPLPQLPGGIRPPDYRTEAPRPYLPELDDRFGLISGSILPDFRSGQIADEEKEESIDSIIEDESAGAPSQECLSNIVKAREMMQVNDWKLKIYPTYDIGYGGVGGEIPGLRPEPTITEGVVDALLQSLDTAPVGWALSNIHVDLEGAGAYAQTSDKKIQEDAILMGGKVLNDVRKILADMPNTIVPISESGQMMLDMQTGKRKVALEYAYKKLKELESLLSSCGDPIECPKIIPPVCPPDSDLTSIGTSGAPCWTLNYTCRPKFKQNCYNVSVRKGSGTETITKCEEVLLDADEWRLMQQQERDILVGSSPIPGEMASPVEDVISEAGTDKPQSAWDMTCPPGFHHDFKTGVCVSDWQIVTKPGGGGTPDDGNVTKTGGTPSTEGYCATLCRERSKAGGIYWSANGDMVWRYDNVVRGGYDDPCDC